MKGKAGIFFLVLCLFSAFSARSQSPSWQEQLLESLQQVHDAFTVELSAEGLASVGRELSSQLSKSTIVQQIPDQNWKIPFLVNIEATQLFAHLQLNHFQIKPQAGGLHFSFKIDQGLLNLGSLRMSSYFVPILRTTCGDSSIVITNTSALEVHGAVGLVVNDQGKVQVNNPRLDFAISENNFRALGPQFCEGPFGVNDYVSKFVLNRLFSNSRSLLEQEVKTQVAVLLPTLEGELNKRLALTYPLSLPGMLLIPALDFGVKLKPRELLISPERLLARMSVDLIAPRNLSSVGSTIGKSQATEASHNAAVVERAEVQRSWQARVGVNTAVINKVLQVLVSKTGREIHLSTSLHERFASFLKIDELQTIWPELENLPREAELVNLFVSMPEAPFFTIKKPENKPSYLEMVVPKIGLRWQVKKAGEWQDFFFTDLRAQLHMDLAVHRGVMSLGLANPVFAVKGRWAPGYHPGNEFFDEELFREILSIISQVGAESLKLQQLSLPPLVVGGASWEFDQLSLFNPYVCIALFGR